jgi:hypothetical protein
MIAPKPRVDLPKTIERLRQRSRMTICAGMLCSDGIVLCSDSMEVLGTVHRSVNKLIELPIVFDDLKAITVCSTNDGTFCDALIDKISTALNRSDGTFESARGAIEDATLEYCAAIWKALTSSQDKPTAELLIGLKTVDDLRLLHLATPVVRSIDGAEFIGYGTDLATYKSGQYGLKNLPADTAAPIIAYIVDIVKNNVPGCGRDTSLAVMHADGKIEHKTQDYITKATQGYKSIEWLTDTWVFPFLPLIVGEAGEDALSMIGKLGKPNTEWAEKISGYLKFLKDRKDSILAGVIPAIPESQKQKTAFGGVPYAARILKNASKQLYEQNLLGDEARASLDAKCEKILELSDLINQAIDSGGAVDQETIKGAIERLFLYFASSPPIEHLMFDASEDE